MNPLVLEKIYKLLFETLKNNSPVMSGNMKAHIKVKKVDLTSGEVVIEISGPSYDIQKWKNTGVIIHTHKYNYADIVNRVGAFGRPNKSTHWVNKACNEACQTIANEIGAILNNELEL